MMSTPYLVSCIFFVGLGTSLALPYFRQFIPHGARVPDPCWVPGRSQRRFVLAPGHYTDSSARNPFGLDFKKTKGNWTTLCKMDSDGDGFYNGFELGDLNCKWRFDDRSTNKFLRRQAFSHPGIPETFNFVTRRYVVRRQERMAACTRLIPRWAS